VLVRVVLWNLAGFQTTIDELRCYLRHESVDQFEQVSGLSFKAWISDETTERVGDCPLSRQAVEPETRSWSDAVVAGERDAQSTTRSGKVAPFLNRSSR
jgi:hypothetical protein